MINLAGYKLTFDDEFNALSISQNGTGTTWLDIRPGSRLGPNTDIGFGNSAFVDAGSGVNPFSLQNGALQITAVPADSAVAGSAHWASGLISTMGSFSQEYGYFEMRAAVPTDAGVWSAFWMLPSNQAAVPPPEVDTVEAYGDTNLWQTVHTNQSGTPTFQQTQTSQPTMTSGYHTYGVMWDPQHITFYFDGQVTGQQNTPADMHKTMYLLADLAMQDKPGVTDTAKQLDIDYIRAYSNDPNAVAVGLGQVSSPDGVDTSSLYGATAANSPVTPTPPSGPTGNLVQNGSFTPAVDNADVILLAAGSTAMAGWTVTAGSVEDIRPTYWQSPDGGHTLDMSGISAGTIQQTLATTVGVQYEVHFKLAGNPEDSTTEIHNLEVSAAGQTQDFSFDSTGFNRSNMGWQDETFTFTATSASTTLQFASLNHSAWGPALGEVSVSAVGAVIPTVDTTAPDTFLTGTPAAQTTSDQATFTFTGTDNPGGSGVALFQASLDGAAYSTAVSGISYSNLADGSHSFAVRAVDAVGNIDATPASFDWTIVPSTPPASPTPPSSGADLVQNGDFAPAVDNADVILLAAGSTAMAGWTVTAGSVEDIRPTYWQSPDGGHTLDMSGISAGTIQQTLATTVGTQYDENFKLAGNPEDSTTNIHTLEVSAAGQTHDFTFDSTGFNRSNMGWQDETFTFTATSASTTLQFASLNHSDWGPALGEVSVHTHSDFHLI